MEKLWLFGTAEILMNLAGKKIFNLKEFQGFFIPWIAVPHVDHDRQPALNYMSNINTFLIYY